MWMVSNKIPTRSTLLYKRAIVCGWFRKNIHPGAPYLKKYFSGDGFDKNTHPGAPYLKKGSFSVDGFNKYSLGAPSMWLLGP